MTEHRKGVIYTTFSYLMWGLLPLYWKMIEHVSSLEILAHRLIWSFVFVFLILTLTSGLSSLWKTICKLFKDHKSLWLLLIAAILITINWFTYIWAVNHDAILEASLGYYINPLVSVLLGYLFLKERMNALQTLATIIAGIGVLFSTVQHGEFPWIALILAISFGLYGLAKKLLAVGPLHGLTLETLVILPASLLYLFYLIINGDSQFIHGDWVTILLLSGAGIVTAVPLLLFAKGAQMIPLYMIGFLQYIAPTISFMIGVFLYQEPFSSTQLITFSCIWIALALFVLSHTRQVHAKQVRSPS
ncbi:EamA family transporter RarD [Hazenella sp. IB182357]|uniref:EamA family transporter RarD n=1 Tax=Polycladospora coralii TaxID=2771432 RepID=A0A926NB27_9BACL|nr:EamA family transporter RarD [Polycladospora coralii]MBD1372867.1 EamA family transporter RarD [Polycladospora coralii]MBS7529444.1 EamA family transporter RarD [Polycladospora coralii]